MLASTQKLPKMAIELRKIRRSNALSTVQLFEAASPRNPHEYPHEPHTA